MVERRGYQQFCGLARALDVVGERWTLLLVRELLYGPKRYSDMLEALPGITTNLLAKRLQAMEQAGLVQRRELSRPGRGRVYELSELGESLEPTIMSLAAWGGHWMTTLGPHDTLNFAWALMSLKRRYHGGLQLTVGLDVTGDHPVAAPDRTRHFRLTLSPDYLKVEECEPGPTDVRLSGELSAFRAWMFQGAALRDLLPAGKLSLIGSMSELRKFSRGLGMAP